MEGTSPEESPENKTGIVRCDLIDCANNFKEITTMPARSSIGIKTPKRLKKHHKTDISSALLMHHINGNDY